MIPEAEVRAAFAARFGGAPEVAVFAPGRVNLLGGHVDYNQGRVLPVAIDRGVWAVARAARRTRIVSDAFEGEANLEGEGAVWTRLFAPIVERPMEVLLASDLPVGAGLSSSAASSVAVLCAQEELHGWRTGAAEIAARAQRAEAEGLGVRCGLMDPLASAAGRRGHALDLDCRTGEYAWLSLRDAEIVVAPTSDARTLAATGYNERRASCERVVAAVQVAHPEVESLKDVRFPWLESAAIDDTDRRRARHVLGEMARVELGRAALTAGDLEAFGGLMYASHASLRDLYGVSTPALDAQVGACRAAPESYGGRVTGAGFGGASVHLVRAGQGEAFAARFETAHVLVTADGPLGRAG